jgi:predicted HicB family RNase H-like nuclease
MEETYTVVVAVNFPIPADLHARLTRLAARQGRSLNAQMVHMLEQATEEIEKEGEER